MSIIRNSIYNEFSHLKRGTVMHSYSFIQQYLLCTYNVPVFFLGTRGIIMNKTSKSLLSSTLHFTEVWRWETK